MDWKEISSSYPKAWNLLIQSEGLGNILFRFYELEIIENEDQTQWFVRDLYDFFDKNELFIAISPEVQYTREIDEDDKNPYYVIEEWYYDIHNNSYEIGGCFNNFPSRREAEEAAFTKAFEILEEKL